MIAEDLVGHSTSASVTFNIDTIAPDLVILSPSEGEIIGDSSLYISVMAEDENSGIDHFEIEVDSLGAIDMGPSSGIVLPPLSYGQHNIAITVLDRAGNHATEEVNITLTNVAPDVAIILSADVFNSSSVTIGWTSEGSEAPIDHFEVDIDSTGWTDVGDSASVTLSDLEEGEHIFTVRAHDVAGNIATDDCTFTVDSLAPVIGFTAPEDMQAFSSADVTLSWGGEDATTWITGYWVSIDDSSWLPMGTTSSLDLPRLSAGQHTASLRAVDKAGNCATDSVTFLIDTVAPEISMIRLNGTNATGAFMIEWECSETEVLCYECSIDGSEWMVVNGTNISLELDAGTHTISVRATDRAGNLGDDRDIEFGTDMQPPVLISASPEGDNVQPDSIILIIFSEPMDPDSMEITMGIQGTISVDGSTVLFTPSSAMAANTTYHVTVDGNDLGGNPMATEEWDFTTATDVGSESGTEEGMHWAVYFGIGAVIGVLAFLIVGMSIIKFRQRRGLIE